MNIRFALAIALALQAAPSASQVTLTVDTPMAPPAWALAQRALLKANAEAAEEFARKYLDDRGFLKCVERWGGNDGPDDAMENFHNWTLAYALGAPESILRLFEKAWEGHLVQYTRARAPTVEMARDGMYWREFVTAFDWEHNGEGLAAFHFYGLGRPADAAYLQRVKRYAGFYTGEDPLAPNYDRERKIIRSLHNGSRGPKLTPATERDWGGEPVPGEPERLTRYSTAANIAGDHPLNLCATTLGMNAYMLTGDSKYRDWVLEYAGAWRDRVIENGGNIPTNVGLDGRIGSGWDGKWYGGVFGWDFWPRESGRNYYMRGARLAFGNAFLLTGDTAFIEPLRRQIDNLYEAQRVENGRILLPNKHGDNGWYGYTPNRHFDVQRDIYLWTLRPEALQRIAEDPWIAFLSGRNPAYPVDALNAEFERMRRGVEGLRRDDSAPDTRASDHPQRFNPVTTAALVNLTLGGNDPGTSGNTLHSQIRYFDVEMRRAGLPEDVAALVEKIDPGGIVVTLVNASPVHPRTLAAQMGAYGEHECESVTAGGKSIAVGAPWFRVRLAPGAGERLVVKMKRYARRPTLEFPPL
ncbi:MAG: hypothetical protein KIT09_29675 [Bryobacteraceae bacterium]|nr:hypothetical protein [Bryobacteraceae bacterium]